MSLDSEVRQVVETSDEAFDLWLQDKHTPKWMSHPNTTELLMRDAWDAAVKMMERNES